MKRLTATSQPDLSGGEMIIRCVDMGGGVRIPEVIFSPVGMITQGWFERHQTFFQRAIQRAQVEQRTGLVRGEQE